MYGYTSRCCTCSLDNRTPAATKQCDFAPTFGAPLALVSPVYTRRRRDAAAATPHRAAITYRVCAHSTHGSSTYATTEWLRIRMKCRCARRTLQYTRYHSLPTVLSTAATHTTPHHAAVALSGANDSTRQPQCLGFRAAFGQRKLLRRPNQLATRCVVAPRIQVVRGGAW